MDLMNRKRNLSKQYILVDSSLFNLKFSYKCFLVTNNSLRRSKNNRKFQKKKKKKKTATMLSTRSKNQNRYETYKCHNRNNYMTCSNRFFFKVSLKGVSNSVYQVYLVMSKSLLNRLFYHIGGFVSSIILTTVE